MMQYCRVTADHIAVRTFVGWIAGLATAFTGTVQDGLRDSQT